MYACVYVSVCVCVCVCVHARASTSMGLCECVCMCVPTLVDCPFSTCLGASWHCLALVSRSALVIVGWNVTTQTAVFLAGRRVTQLVRSVVSQLISGPVQ